MVRINGVPIEEVKLEELRRVRDELGEMIDNDEGTEGDAVAYVEIETELTRRVGRNGFD